MAYWDDTQGRVSYAYDEWKLVENDQRAFLRLGLEFAMREYDRLWKESEEEPYYEGGPELIDSFEAKVDNLHHQDFVWMLLGGLLRDAVTSFEVYLEKAREEILRHQGSPIPVEDESPWWGPQKRFFRQFGVEIETNDVKQVRDLRNFLTHRRGELRTEADREQYRLAHPDEFPPLAVELSKEQVLGAMDTLAAAVRQIDSAVYEYSSVGASLPNLQP